MPRLTKAELEELIDRKDAELQFCHELIAKLGADFQKLDSILTALEKALGRTKS